MDDFVNVTFLFLRYYILLFIHNQYSSRYMVCDGSREDGKGWSERVFEAEAHSRNINKA